ncbi:hypothetical protein DRE_01139 [Drechslerella stenobrocha 248]|uniref:Uncharacterized protein n=1 Tax=Drechslerella stenobrocha 248 TaxID=1043628 RepID=W7HWK8_9PEZI|nr:hypothetical protein DRE_01139 [Drechslerella stenobrocha 248]
MWLSTLILPLLSTTATSFLLAFVRLPPAEHSGINYLTNKNITGIQSLEVCHEVPFGYFDIAQFIPDDVTAQFRNEYKFDPRKHQFWLTVRDATVTRVEFFTGKKCRDGMYESDRKGFLRESAAKRQGLLANTANKGQAPVRNGQSPDLMGRVSGGQLNPPRSEPAELEGDENYYKDFDISWRDDEDDMTAEEARRTEAQLAAQGDEYLAGWEVIDDLEPPVPGETKEEEISRQERNFLRFYDDVEPNSRSIALDKEFTTLEWKENWRSFKLLYVPSSNAPPVGKRDL